MKKYMYKARAFSGLWVIDEDDYYVVLETPVDKDPYGLKILTWPRGLDLVDEVGGCIEIYPERTADLAWARAYVPRPIFEALERLHWR